MSGFQFATCDRRYALQFLQQLYKKIPVQDTPDDAGPLLDLVEKDIIRIQDPNMHRPAQVVSSKNWPEDDPKEQAVIMATIKAFHALHT